MKRQFDAACRQYQVKEARGAGYAEWEDGVKSGLPPVKLLGKTVQASNPTTAAPQEVRANNATVRSFGKNLFIRLKEETANGVTLTHLADGGYLLNGTCTGSNNFQTRMRLPAGRYTLSCVYDGVMPDDGNARVQVYNPSNPVVWSSIGNSEAIDKSFSFTVSSACSPYFQIRVQQGHTYDHVKIYPLLVRGEYTSQTMPEVVPYYDGGEVTAPKLMCAVNGSCQSTYDPQTGEFVNWWWPKIVFDGSEHWTPYPARDGFACWSKIPEVMWRNAYWCNQCVPANKGGEYFDKMGLLMGVHSKSMYVCYCPFYDASLEDSGLAHWKAHLAEHPLEVWVARNEPEITKIGAQRLTCPTGFGQIIQVAGDVPDAPLEVKYLSHGGNVK